MYSALTILSKLCTIDRIITCRTDNVTEFNVQICHFAEEHHIPLEIKRISKADVKLWKQEGCDMAVCGGYYYRIPVVDSFPILNIHPSLLPVGRGAWPMPMTLLKGLDKTGITIHKMTADLDKGDIILQREIPVYKEDNLKTLTERLCSVLPDMLTELIRDYEALFRNARKQGEGEYWKLVEEKDLPLTPDMSCKEAAGILRAFYGYECIYKTENAVYGIMEGEVSAARPLKETVFPLKDGFLYGDKVRKII